MLRGGAEQPRPGTEIHLTVGWLFPWRRGAFESGWVGGLGLPQGTGGPSGAHCRPGSPTMPGVLWGFAHESPAPDEKKPLNTTKRHPQEMFFGGEYAGIQHQVRFSLRENGMPGWSFCLGGVSKKSGWVGGFCPGKNIPRPWVFVKGISGRAPMCYVNFTDLCTGQLLAHRAGGSSKQLPARGGCLIPTLRVLWCWNGVQEWHEPGCHLAQWKQKRRSGLSQALFF